MFLILINKKRSITGFVFITIYFYLFIFEIQLEIYFNINISTHSYYFIIDFFLDYIADFHLIDSLIRFYNSENKRN